MRRDDSNAFSRTQIHTSAVLAGVTDLRVCPAGRAVGLMTDEADLQPACLTRFTGEEGGVRGSFGLLGALLGSI